MARERSGRMRVGAVIIEWVAHSRWTREVRTRLIDLVYSFCFVNLVDLVVSFNQTDKPNNPLLPLASCYDPIPR